MSETTRREFMKEAKMLAPLAFAQSSKAQSNAPAERFDPRPASLSFVVAVTGLFTGFFFIFPAPVVAAAQAAANVLFQ